MIIQSHTAYKSIGPIRPLTLPDFVVLSGVNGSGKTHLLQGIANKQIAIMIEDGILGHIKFLDHDGLKPNDTGSAYGISHVSSAQQMYNAFYDYQERLKNERGDLTHEEQYRALEPSWSKIALRAGKTIDELNEGDFYKYYPLDYKLPGNGIFHQRFSELFRQYYDRKEDNEYHQFATERKGIASYPYLTDEEFIDVYGEPPWILVNRIIEEAQLPYYLTVPEKIHRETSFEAKLVNKLNEAEINFSDLSSGEKVIMSLALALYNAKYDFEFPKLLLMDEPDAHLHPSMTQQFLDVIQNVFVADKAIKVIMTTHSPSTVALAPEEAIFIMNRATPRISKATKDVALRTLTSGVPTLSVNYENRRQVFVESKHDIAFYEKVYERLKEWLIPEISINFISSGVDGEGSCTHVKEIVNKLTSFGNHTIYGIIDWDTSNEGNEFVKVLGKGKRYSIENYIFDPIFLAAFLLRERYVPYAVLGLRDRDRHTDFKGFDNQTLQSLANLVVDRVRAIVGDLSDEKLQEVEYVCGKKIVLPTWFLTIQGHELENILKGIFPQLNKYKRPWEFKREVINKVIDEIPEFLPKELLTLLREIQNFQR